jgi:membrane protease subunit (stomatin/prohibitin family)
MAAAMKVNAESQAMMDAAKNPNGAAMGFFGMGMAQQAAGGGTDAASLFAMGQQQAAAKEGAAKMQPAGGWKCPQCGNTNQDKMNVARRTCGYIGTQFWNQGRTQEIKERVLHL